jgi:long-chain fatty acid transport protein
MRNLAAARRRGCAGTAIAALLVAFNVSAAGAQASLQVPMQFDFLNPGARSLAVGSAFVGLADDATSAFTNPAGLILLTAPELSFDIRSSEMESLFVSGGRLSPPVSNLGIDRSLGVTYGNSPATHTGLSYLSFVYPWKNFRIAGYRHEFVALDQSFEADGMFQGEGSRELALRARRDMSITAYGAATAYRYKQLSVGATFAAYQFKLDAEFDRFFAPDLFEKATFTPDTRIGHAVQTADELSLAFNVGGLYIARDKPQSRVDLIQIGAVYRKGADFEFEAFEGDINAPVTRDSTFRVPDAAGGGVAVRVARTATFTAEITRVNYKSLLDGYVSAQSGNFGKGENFTVDNATELHAGAEYILNVPASPKLRIGVWHDPDHAVRYEAPANPDFFDQRFAAYLPARGAVTHFTFGGGVSIRQLEINAGFDLSSRTKVFSVSSIVRFVKLGP